MQYSLSFLSQEKEEKIGGKHEPLRLMNRAHVSGGLAEAMSQKHATTLVKSRCARGARVMFDEMPDRDVVAWMAMLSSYASNSLYREAQDLFWRMAAEGGP